MADFAMDAARDDQRRRRFPVSASFLMNFGALVGLFAAIALLQHFGNGMAKAPATPGNDRAVASSAPPGIPDLGSTPSPSGAPVAAPATELSVTAEAPAEAPAAQVTVAALAPVSPPPMDDEEPPIPAAEETPSPSSAPAPAPVPEQARIARKTPGLQRTAVARRLQQKPRLPASPPPTLFDEDRSFDIGSLDNEAARQGYLAANRRLANAGSRQTASAPVADDIPLER